MIQIESLASTHLREVLALADGAFGGNYLTREAVMPYIDHPDRAAWVALAGHSVAGFLLARLAAPDPSWPDGPVVPGVRAGILQTIAVAPGYMRQGIGTALTRHFASDLAGRCKVCFSVCWERDDAPFMRILDRAGWKPVKRLPGYWAEDSLRQGYSCAQCGGPPCTCVAVIYQSGISVNP